MSVSMSRLGRSVYSNPEDEAVWPAVMRKLGLDRSQRRPKGDDAKPRTESRGEAKVERIRRAHMNAIENVLPFLTIGLLYALSGLPHATMHFYVFTVSRFLHTFFYAVLEAQPWRSFAHFTAMTSLLSMSVRLVALVLHR